MQPHRWLRLPVTQDSYSHEYSQTIATNDGVPANPLSIGVCWPMRYTSSRGRQASFVSARGDLYGTDGGSNCSWRLQGAADATFGGAIPGEAWTKARTRRHGRNRRRPWRCTRLRRAETAYHCRWLRRQGSGSLQRHHERGWSVRLDPQDGCAGEEFHR